MADKRLTMEIKGMTCAACASRIEKGLRRMAGVVDAQVNLARERASVVYDDDRLSPVEVADKIREGKVAAAGVLVGAVMKATGGRADARAVRELVLSRFSQ